MPTLNKYHLVFIVILLVFPARLFADDLPTGDEINLLAQKAQQTADDFYNKTFEIRMRYEYAGRFIDSNDKTKLLELATQASTGLSKIAKDQNNLKKQIEDYQDDDWEARFGRTGLWRRLAADVLKTKSEVPGIDSVAAVADDTKTGCTPLAIRNDCNSIGQAMAEIKCLGRCEPNQLETIAESLAKSECNENPEMLLSLAILQNKYAPDKLRKTVLRHSLVGSMLGKIVLDCLASDPNLDSLNPVTAELVASAAGTYNPDAHRGLLLAIAGDDRLKTPGTLAIAGVAVAETNPPEAIKFFIESSALQFQGKEALLDINARSIAENAARLAFDNFTKQNIDCNLAVAAFDNYKLIASDRMSEELQYLYGKILLDCGQTLNAVETFTKLAQTSQSIWRDKASFQLLIMQINAGRGDSLPQLREFILNCKGQDKPVCRLRLEAMVFYCNTVLTRDSNDSSRQVLTILDTAEPTPDFPYDLYKALATMQPGQLEEAVLFMSKAIDTNDISNVPQVVSLLSEILDKTELWQQNARDFNEMMQNCTTLAQFAYKSLKDRETTLILAELSIFVKIKEQVPLYVLYETDQNDIISMRVKARLLMAEGDLQQALQLWGKIIKLHSSEEQSQSRKSYGWWRAKYYELECMSKLSSANLKDIHHAIEVLQSTYTEIPTPWPEKLESLKQHCGIN